NRRNLADLLLVDPGYGEFGGRFHREGDAVGRLDRHRMAVTEGELEVAALLLHAVADAEDFHLLLVALGDTGDHLVEQGPGQAVQRTVATLVVRAGNHQASVFLRDGDRLGNGQRELTLRALHGDVLAVDGHLDTRGNHDGIFADTRHVRTSLTRRRRGLPRLLPAEPPDGR